MRGWCARRTLRLCLCNAARFSRLMAEQGYRQLADRINLLADPLLPFRGRILKYQQGCAE